MMESGGRMLVAIVLKYHKSLFSLFYLHLFLPRRDVVERALRVSVCVLASQTRSDNVFYFCSIEKTLMY